MQESSMKQVASRAIRLPKARVYTENRKELQENFWKAGRSACYLLHGGFLLGVFFDPED
jgi:DNA-binding ferritin-like protein (Dps family)